MDVQAGHAESDEPGSRRTGIMNVLLGLLLAFGVGIVCRLAGLPLPAPLALTGAASSAVHLHEEDPWQTSHPSSLYRTAHCC
jgi:hypothetical protein